MENSILTMATDDFNIFALKRKDYGIDYYLKNKDKRSVKPTNNMTDYHKQYYQKNKEKFTALNKERTRDPAKRKIDNEKQYKKIKKAEVKIECECGASVFDRNIKKHQQSQKHKIFIETGEPKPKFDYKTYNIKNKQTKEQNTQYYEKRKPMLQQKVECECGVVTTKGARSRHNETLQHIVFIREGIIMSRAPIAEKRRLKKKYEVSGETYYQKNKDKCKTASLEWYHNNKDNIIVNKERVKAYDAARYNKKKKIIINKLD